MSLQNVSRETIKHEVRRDNGEVIATCSHYLHAKLFAESAFALHRKVYPFLNVWTVYRTGDILAWSNGRTIRS